MTQSALVNSLNVHFLYLQQSIERVSEHARTEWTKGWFATAENGCFLVGGCSGSTKVGSSPIVV